MKILTAIVALAGLASGSAAFAQSPPSSGAGWQVAGTLGMMQFVVVEESKARQRAFYDDIAAVLCPPGATCFLRFFTNSIGAPLGVPLADGILAEPAAMFQRSAKQNREVFQWSCRLGVPDSTCF